MTINDRHLHLQNRRHWPQRLAYDYIEAERSWHRSSDIAASNCIPKFCVDVFNCLTFYVLNNNVFVKGVGSWAQKAQQNTGNDKLNQVRCMPFTLQVPAHTSWWRHQMETLPALLALCAVDSPHKGQWRGALMFSLFCAWRNGWANKRDAGDLRRHRAYYDVAVMYTETRTLSSQCQQLAWWLTVPSHKQAKLHFFFKFLRLRLLMIHVYVSIWSAALFKTRCPEIVWNVKI